MGIIDALEVTIRCPVCGVVESQKVLDKGSMWNGSYWGDVPKFKNFDVEWVQEDRAREPDIGDAVCKRCRVKALVSERYRV